MSPLGHKTGTALIVRPGPSKISYRLLRAWKKAWVRRMVMVAMPLGLLAGGGLWLGIQPGVQKWVGTRCAALIDTFVQRSEFTVSGVAIQGASDRLRARILATVSPDLGTSSLVFDIDAIQARVLTVGGVRSANLRLDGRGILHIAVQERTARALWRDDENRLWCVDANGVIIEPAASRAAYPRLPVVMGDGAQAAIASALALLHAAPDLVPHLRALVRVGQRRWDMVLDRGIRIQLPETAPEIALARVMALQYGEELLERDLSVIDMRLDARPSLRLNEDALETYRLQNAVEAGGGKNT